MQAKQDQFVEEIQTDEEENAFVTHLSVFNGPLDLLISLIKKAQIDIKDVMVSGVTEQYLAYMSQTADLDMNAASAFLNMAATLLEIKARSLLPKPPQEEIDAQDLEAQLVAQLERYQLYLQATQGLRELEARQSDVYARLPSELLEAESRDIVLLDSDACKLMNAFVKLLQAAATEPPPPPTHEVTRDTYTVMQCTLNIVRALRQFNRIRFSTLFKPASTRDEWIATFLALLELIRQGKIGIQQPELFSDIEIFLKSDADDNTGSSPIAEA